MEGQLRRGGPENGVYVKGLGAGVCGIARDENGGMKRKGGERGGLAVFAIIIIAAFFFSHAAGAATGGRARARTNRSG